MGACESGLGRAELSSEYIGLPNVFLGAGVHYVVGSLWTVNALATAMLLGRVFELLSDGNKTLPAALNCAQRELMVITREDLRSWVCARLPTMNPELIDQFDSQPFAHAYFWAGFYASGGL
jgi:CHAT domain-containing protein